jgi:glucans biosynthesis protein
MFVSGPLVHPVEDYREAIHDSDGLMMINGHGEWLWRPLNNPKNLQVSAFQDLSPRGFGLIQRGRNYADYRDVEARYETRPSAWVEPIGDWGPGSVHLFEIPSLVETNDNIVAYWQPKDPLTQGSEYSFVYRLHWCARWPIDPTTSPLSQVAFSGSGVAVDYSSQPPKYDPNIRLYVIEYEGALVDDDFTAAVTADSGKIDNVTVSRNPVNQLLRLSFRHDATGLDTAELRASLKRGETPAGETWLFRWTRA